MHRNFIKEIVTPDEWNLFVYIVKKGNNKTEFQFKEEQRNLFKSDNIV